MTEFDVDDYVRRVRKNYMFSPRHDPKIDDKVLARPPAKLIVGNPNINKK